MKYNKINRLKGFCPTFSIWFYVFCILGGISDVFDRIIARHLGKETKFGAKSDTIADIIFIGLVLSSKKAKG